MSIEDLKSNRVQRHRLAMGLSQASLSDLAGISRTGLSAIESHRMAPSVATALALARALKTSVEVLFGTQAATKETVWACEPCHQPTRFWSAEVAGRTVLYPVEPVAGLAVRQDGLLRKGRLTYSDSSSTHRTLVLATCDPAASYLASEYGRQTPFRMIVLRRSSRQALELLQKGLVHVAGIHLAESSSAGGNQGILKQSNLEADVELLSIARWDEGVAFAPAVKLRSIQQIAHSRLRWIGRLSSAGARRCQDQILGSGKTPRHTANDHFEVAAAIRSGLVDAGVCVRVVAEEAGIQFLPVCDEDYDLCYLSSSADDPRLMALVEVVRSLVFRETLAELPGYRLKAIGQTSRVKSNRN